MSFDDNWLSNGLPVFNGGKDRSIARKAIDRLGGPSGFKTSYVNNPDGSVTTVQLKGDMPPQITTTTVETGCPHGLYYNGVVGQDVGGITVTGGQVRKDNGSVVQLPGNKPVLGNVVTIDGVIMSGAKRRICGGSEYGKVSWPVTATDGSKFIASLTLSGNQPLSRTDDVPLHQWSLVIDSGATTQTLSGYVTGLVRSNLSNAATYGHLDGEVYNQHVPVLTDISLDGRKVLVEIHEILVTPDGSIEYENRVRLSGCLTFVAAYEIVLTGDVGGASATGLVVVRPQPYYRTSVGIPTIVPVYIETVPVNPPTFPTDWWQMQANGTAGSNGRKIYGVCYSNTGELTAFFSYRIVGPATAYPVNEAFYCGTQEAYRRIWSGSEYYTNPAYNSEDPLTWNYTLYYPIRLSNRTFSVAVSDQWLSDYAYTSPYNEWRLSYRVSPNGIDTTAVTLPKEGTWRMEYGFYYKGIEPEIYPNVYGSARTTNGAVATALDQSLCWV